MAYRRFPPYNRLDELILVGSISGEVTISADPTTTSYSLVLPPAQGGAGEVLVNDGSGNLSWGAGGGGGSDSFYIWQGDTGDMTATSSTDVATLIGDGTYISTSFDSMTDTGTISLTAGSIDNAAVSDTAAIARTKLASGTASHVLINDGSGVMFSEAQLAISRGGTALSALGTALQQLRVNAGGTALEYFTPSGGAGDVLQNGNSFGATMVIGTNDNFALRLETNTVSHFEVVNDAALHHFRSPDTSGTALATRIQAQTNTTTAAGGYLQLWGGGSGGTATPSQMFIARAINTTANDSGYIGGNGFGGSQAGGMTFLGGTGQAATASAGGSFTFTGGPAEGSGQNGFFSVIPGGAGTGLKGYVSLGGRQLRTGTQRVTSSTTVTVQSDVCKVIADYGSLQASATYTMPADAQLLDGQEISFMAGTNGITALTLNAGSGSSILSPLTTLTNGTFAKYHYIKATTTWVRMG